MLRISGAGALQQVKDLWEKKRMETDADLVQEHMNAMADWYERLRNMRPEVRNQEHVTKRTAYHESVRNLSTSTSTIDLAAIVRTYSSMMVAESVISPTCTATVHNKVQPVETPTKRSLDFVDKTPVETPTKRSLNFAAILSSRSLIAAEAATSPTCTATVHDKVKTIETSTGDGRVP